MAPDTDDNADYLTTSNRRRPDTRVLLLDVAQQVWDAYAKYITAQGRPSEMVPLGLPANVRSALISNFDLVRSDQGLESIRDALMSRTRSGECPMCGSAQAGTLDHYLPKSIFPEFSILGKNLVPACSYCNNTKSDRLPTGPSSRFFHPYFDQLPPARVLFANIDVEDTVTVDYQIRRSPDVDAQLVDVLEFHFVELGLAKIYRANANGELFNRYEALTEYLGPGQDVDAVKRYLDREARSCRAYRGLNDWKTALLSTLAQHTEFCAGGFFRLRSST